MCFKNFDVLRDLIDIVKTIIIEDIMIFNGIDVHKIKFLTL